MAELVQFPRELRRAWYVQMAGLGPGAWEAVLLDAHVNGPVDRVGMGAHNTVLCDIIRRRDGLPISWAGRNGPVFGGGRAA